MFFFDLTDRAAVNRGKRGTKLFVPHRNKTRAQQAYVKFITRVDSHPKVLFTDFDEFDHFLLANDVQHVVVPKGEHHSNGPVEKCIGDIAPEYDQGNHGGQEYSVAILGYWSETLSFVTSPAVDEPSKTTFEAAYGQSPDDALPPVGYYAVRLLEKQHRKDFCFGLTSQSGILLGYATYTNIFRTVLFAEKKVSFDPSVFPFTDKSSDNPRYKCLDNLLGHDSDAIDGVDNPTFDDDVEVDLQDS